MKGFHTRAYVCVWGEGDYMWSWLTGFPAVTLNNNGINTTAATGSTWRCLGMPCTLNLCQSLPAAAAAAAGIRTEPQPFSARTVRQQHNACSSSSHHPALSCSSLPAIRLVGQGQANSPTGRTRPCCTTSSTSTCAVGARRVGMRPQLGLLLEVGGRAAGMQTAHIAG